MPPAEPGASGAGTIAACHCGAVRIALARRPDEIVSCNCSLCRSYGVTWAYLDVASLDIPTDLALTDTYAWNGRNVDFHRCRNCGCVTHWIPRDRSRSRRGINANLLPVDVFASARLRHRDGAGSGKFLD